MSTYTLLFTPQAPARCVILSDCGTFKTTLYLTEGSLGKQDIKGMSTLILSWDPPRWEWAMLQPPTTMDSGISTAMLLLPWWTVPHEPRARVNGSSSVSLWDIWSQGLDSNGQKIATKKWHGCDQPNHVLDRPSACWKNVKVFGTMDCRLERLKNSVSRVCPMACWAEWANPVGFQNADGNTGSKTYAFEIS